MNTDWGRISPAEIEFGKVYKKQTGEQLMPADDWFSPRTGTLYEVKDISRYSSQDFVGKEIRMNKESMERHSFGLVKNQKQTIVVIKLADKWMWADQKDVISNSRTDGLNRFGDRPTLFVKFSIFKEGLPVVTASPQPVA